MAGGIFGTSLNSLLAPYNTSLTGLGVPLDLFGTSSYGQTSPYSGYNANVAVGENAGSGYLASDQTHQSSQDAGAVWDGTTTNNLYSQQTDTQKVNVYLDPQVGPGSSGTYFPVSGGILSSLLGSGLANVPSPSQMATTEVGNNQEIGLDQSAYAEEGGTAINNAYQVQNNVQIVNMYLDLNLQLPGMPQNPWVSNPWLPSTGYSYPTTTTYGSPTGTSVSGYPGYSPPAGTVYSGGSTGNSQPAYDPSHVEPFKDFIYVTTDLDYSERSQVRETIKEYARFFDDNGARSLGRTLMTLAGAVGSAENMDRAESRFLRFEDAVNDMTAEDKAYFFQALEALAAEVPYLVSDPSYADELSFVLYDLGDVVGGDSYAELGFEDETQAA